ncbi:MULTISPECIES: LysR family transcriptional regulator [Pseudomonadota]|uniref:HTH-type transcriptional regulator TtuA n=1 Tax=Agrobacterium tumefaciens TaxID=358 RepID=A0AA44JAR1_AGRTU|nr:MULTISPECIES: LysR family transcriptional regulator [Pseudomonadota]NTB87872.1 LysR family transcriptional regulator [Agrobacterium tumefaciens]NTC17060.1 LysR family transcriptional regulator [Agrobacterium tumefaciens]NTC31119.1 LysR family transcriptional regulator [Agrobacterium tumefaciens]
MSRRLKLGAGEPSSGIPLCISDLQCFLSVCEAGSIRKAAEAIGVGQPSLSRRIQKLEEMLGLSLFERRTTGVRLTPFGWRFMSQSRMLVAGVQDALESASMAGTAMTGKLDVGIAACLSGGPVRNLFSAFIEAHCDVAIQVIGASSNELSTLLNQRLVDAIITSRAPKPSVEDSVLLSRERMLLAVSTDHEWSERHQILWEELNEASDVLWVTEPFTAFDTHRLGHTAAFAKSELVHRNRLSREEIMGLVGLGLGITFVYEHCRGITYPNVTYVPIGGDGEPTSFSLTWLPENDNPALRRFISLAKIEAKTNGSLS